MSLQQLHKFNSFLIQFTRLSYNRAISPIYRGDKLRIIYKKLSLDYDTGRTENYQELLERLFMIGDKARSYLSKENFGLQRTWNFGVNQCDEQAYSYILDTIREGIKKIKSKNVVTFFENNMDFAIYFKDKAGYKQHFITTASRLPHDKRLAMRNYHLKLLHQIGSINYRDRSNVVSTSGSYAVAERFGRGDGAEGSVIIHAWEPVVAKFHVHKKYGLPVYQSRPFSNQKEVSLMSGIFPHYIIGLEGLLEGEMYINPNLFSTRITKDTFSAGFTIDQQRFEEIIQQTNYDRYFVDDGDGYSDIQL